MKTYTANDKFVIFALIPILIVLGVQRISYGQNLNVGEPRTVRMIYFLPNDRPYRQEVVDAMKTVIQHAQTFFAEQMLSHGYPETTFHFETDAQGEPLIHRVDGQYPDSHYGYTFGKVAPAVNLDLSNNIYLFVYDTTSSLGEASGGRSGKNIGSATCGPEVILAANESARKSLDDPGAFTTVVHELGHAFGLHHDWRDGSYIMSYGPRPARGNRLSACAAEFLAVHPYFNRDIPIEETPPPVIELISSPGYPTGSTSVSVRLKVSDSDGIYQVILVAQGGLKLCKVLNGEQDATVEFDYDGIISPATDPNRIGTSLSNPLVHSIRVEAVDVSGDVGYTNFELFNISTQDNLFATLERHTYVFSGEAAPVSSVAFSSDGTTLASGSWSGRVKLWDTATLTNIATLEGHSLGATGVDSVAFSPDGTTLASGRSNNIIELWDVATLTNIATLRGHTSNVDSVAFSPDGTTLASGGADKTVKLWDIATLTNIATLEEHTSYVNSVTFSPDGAILASGGEDDTIKLWDVATQKSITTFGGRGSGISTVAFSPDGTTLAFGGGFRWLNIELLDIATLTNIATLEGHTSNILSIAYSPDGAMLASGSYDSTIKLWNVATRRNIATFNGGGDIESVAFSPDGTILASSAEDGTVNLWDVRSVMATTEPQRAPPVFIDGSSTTRTVVENTDAGRNIGTAIAATDADTGDTLTYSLGGTDAASFSIVSTSGQLQTNAALDYETKNSYSVTVSVSDGNGGSDSIAVTINVTNVTETPTNNVPEFSEGTSTTRSVAENTAVGTNIGTAIAATDADNDTLTYSLGGTDAFSFSIVSTSGQLKTKAALDYEAKSSYSVTVSVSDGNSGSASITVTINITDVIEIVAPPVADGMCRVGDTLEPGESCTYPGTDTEFSVNSNGNGQFLFFSSASRLNIRDTQINNTSYTLVAEKRNSGDWEIKELGATAPPPSTTNNTPVFTEGASTTRTVAENTATGMNIGTPVSATDADNDTLTYSLSGTDAASFNLDTATGQLRTSSILNANTQSTYTVTVSVSDGKGGSDSITVIITVTGTGIVPPPVEPPPAADGFCRVGDTLAAGESCTYPGTDTEFSVNSNGNGQFLFFSSASRLNIRDTQINNTSYTLVAEKRNSGDWEIKELGATAPPPAVPPPTTNNVPVFTEAPSTTRTIAENTATGMNIGTPIAAMDVDNDTLTYSLGGTDAASFSIDSMTGQLQTKDALDAATKPTYTVTITASDGTDTATITVTINVTGTGITPPPVVPPPVEPPPVADGFCRVGDTLASGESCTYPGTDTEFSVNSTGNGQFLFFSSGSRLNIRDTQINNVSYTLVAEKLNSGDWEIKALGATAPPPAPPPATNHAPAFTDGVSTTRSVAENTAAGQNIGSAVSAMDADNDTLTYTLGGTDAAAFDIDSATGQLKTKTTLDAANKSTYTVTITVSDDSLTATIPVTITVTRTGIDPPPVAPPPVADGICRVGDVLASGESCTYPGTNTEFSVNSNGNGQFLFFSSGSRLNIRDTQINNTSYTLVAEKLNSGSWEIKELGAAAPPPAPPPATNNAPIFTEGVSTTRSVAENTAAGQNIGSAVSAMDADNDTLIYTLGGTDAAAFSIDKTTGQLRTKSVLDYEAQHTYRVTVTASDSSLTVSISVTINVSFGQEKPIKRRVRLIYFLPNDRPFRPEVVQKMKVEIRNVQTFFAEQMQAHGHGNKTFRIETDAQGEPIVHRVDGQYPDSHYHADVNYMKEIDQKFDRFDGNVYFIVWDNSTNLIRGAGGWGGDSRNSEGEYSGSAEVPGGFNFHLAAHELGHAFGLDHDYRDNSYIMGYGTGALSACAAEFLTVHPYFNPGTPLGNTSPTIQLISSRTYPAGTKRIPIQLKVSDPDGLHQVRLNVDAALKACRGLTGKKEAIVEFNYDGVIPSQSTYTIHVSVVDTKGDRTEKSFTLSENSPYHIDTLEIDTTRISSVAFSPDGTTLAAGTNNGAKLWDVATRTNIATLVRTGEFALTGNSVAFSPDGTTLAVGATLWDVATKRNIGTFESLSLVESVAFSPDGAILASGGTGGTARLWNIASQTKIATFLHVPYEDPLNTPLVLSLAFSPDGAILASGGTHGTAKLWDIAAQTKIATLPHEGLGNPLVSSLAFSPDGTMLASAQSNSIVGIVRLWDVATKREIRTLEHRFDTTSVAFSPDGTILASGERDGTVKLWDVVTGTKIVTFPHSSEVYSVAISTDGTMLASGTRDGTVELWDISSYTTATPLPASPAWNISQNLLAMLTPKETALFANYPNPFNPETWIPYQLAEPAEVTITIYDIRGSVVRTLRLGHQPAGTYRSRSKAAHWDGRNQLGEKVATGVYFYTLKAGDYIATRKLLIQK